MLGDVVRVPPDRPLPLIKEESRGTSSESDPYIPPNRAAARQLDGTDFDWKYRGRTDSENAEGQPISAPSGLAAQKDEGFQRFYKAVVSPTHVRVTAGGRIVPNTRGSTSPTGKWSKERVTDDTTSRPSSRDQPEHAPYPIARPAFGHFGPIYPGFSPGMPPGMHPGMHPGQAPFPMMPWRMMGAFGMPPPQAPGFSTVPQNPDSSKSDKQSDAGVGENQPQIRISPQEQFDQPRPCVYNGQWMMPPGGPFYPYGVPPFQGFPPHMAGHPMMHHPMASNHAVQPQDLKAQFGPQGPYGSSSSGSSAPNFVPPSNPPISSIRPSEITKKQIEVLRGSLRYLEDQLQYNKHQIDEKGTEHQARMVRQQIQQFEKNLEAQLAIEEGRHSKSERKNENSSVSSHGALRSKSSATSETKPESISQDALVSPDEPAVSFRNKRERSQRLSSGINSTKSVSIFKPEIVSPSTDRLKMVSGLPSHAALAPPFQPRSESVTPVPTNTPTHGGFPTSHEVFIAQVPAESTEASTVFFEAPYLVGHVPAGANPDLVQDLDYVYTRDLTEDELRARHMYWGKTPRHLQKGLPKFDGRNFYPPSPVKNSSSKAPAPVPIHVTPSGETPIDYRTAKPKAEADPFRSFPRLRHRVARTGLASSTQSESLPRPEDSLLGHPKHRMAQIGRSHDDIRKTVSEAARASSDSKGKSSSDEGDDDKNLIFKGRRAMSRTG